MTDASPTIFALATGIGKSAVAIIRVSGPQCQLVLQKLCRRTVWQARHATYASLFDETGALIDKAVVLFFPGPASFTGEDVVELHITGGRGVRSAVLQSIGSLPGTRPAEAGEFARRAFKNGKLDLLQVEGLAAIVDAETRAEARYSALMAFGKVSQECERARFELITAASYLEGFLDFSDIEAPPDSSLAAVRESLGRAASILQPLLGRKHVRERLRDGYTVAIVGKPNAGKSTLMNHLLQRDAAIVSEIPGTTRDYLEFFVEMGGFPIVFIDTAGFREATDPVERLGIQRSRDRVRAADLLIWLSDSGFEDDAFLAVETDTLRVCSKQDLPSSAPALAGALSISALTGDGVSELVAKIIEKAGSFFQDAASPGLGSTRQIEAVSDAMTAIERAMANTELPEEMIAEEVRTALTAVGRITGRVDVEHVLDEVFSRLCVGK